MPSGVSSCYGQVDGCAVIVQQLWLATKPICTQVMLAEASWLSGESPNRLLAGGGMEGFARKQ